MLTPAVFERKVRLSTKKLIKEFEKIYSKNYITLEFLVCYQGSSGVLSLKIRMKCSGLGFQNNRNIKVACLLETLLVDCIACAMFTLVLETLGHVSRTIRCNDFFIDKEWDVPKLKSSVLKFMKNQNYHAIS